MILGLFLHFLFIGLNSSCCSSCSKREGISYSSLLYILSTWYMYTICLFLQRKTFKFLRRKYASNFLPRMVTAVVTYYKTENDEIKYSEIKNKIPIPIFWNTKAMIGRWPNLQVRERGKNRHLAFSESQ